MAESKMKEVAKLFGVGLDEEFRIKYDNVSTYVFLEDGLFEKISDGTYVSCYIDNLLTGESELVKLPKPILDDVEREYLSNVIKPFRDRDRVIYIVKRSTYCGDFIKICLEQCNDMYSESIVLPYFKKGTMYKGMKVDYEYSLEELCL